tara:strand:- start:131 stop:337 length:207 start_codon:yes stop_codon:yes gene_type:complete
MAYKKFRITVEYETMWPRSPLTYVVYGKSIFGRWNMPYGTSYFKYSYTTYELALEAIEGYKNRHTYVD